MHTPIASAFAETDARKALWIQLAALYLDTEIRPNLPRLAHHLIDSNLSIADLTWIFQHEVTPAVHGNLLQVAGEWAGFDQDWLSTRILALREQTLAMSQLRLRMRYRMQGHADADWQACLAFKQLLQSFPSTQRSNAASTFCAYGWVYFEREFERTFDTQLLVLKNASPAVKSHFDQVELIYRASLIRGVDHSALEAQGQVLRALLPG